MRPPPVFRSGSPPAYRSSSPPVYRSAHLHHDTSLPLQLLLLSCDAAGPHSCCHCGHVSYLSSDAGRYHTLVLTPPSNCVAVASPFVLQSSPLVVKSPNYYFVFRLCFRLLILWDHSIALPSLFLPIQPTLTVPIQPTLLPRPNPNGHPRPTPPPPFSHTVNPTNPHGSTQPSRRLICAAHRGTDCDG